MAVLLVNTVSGFKNNKYCPCALSDPKLQPCAKPLLPVFLIKEICGYFWENGSSQNYNVVLDSEPTDDVIVDMISNDIAEGTISPAQFTFTSENWNVPQTGTATGADDEVNDGDQKWEVEFTISSADNNYNILSRPVPHNKVEFRTIDDEDWDCFIDPETDQDHRLITTENSQQVSFTISLTRAPTQNVYLNNISSSDTSEGIVDTQTIVFTPTNWNAPQTVWVTGVDDSANDGTRNYNIDYDVFTSDDNKYDGVKCGKVRMKNLDNE